MRFAPSWRLGWRIRLPWPFYLAGTILRSGGRSRRRQVYHGTLPGWTCPHNHTRPDTAEDCARAELRRRSRSPLN